MRILRADVAAPTVPDAVDGARLSALAREKALQIDTTTARCC